MTSINLAVIGGTVGTPGQLGSAATGQSVTNFTVRAEETRTEPGTGQPRKVNVWHRIVAYGDLAYVAANLTSGTVLTVQGRFQHNTRTENGVKQHSVDIVAEKIDVVYVPKKHA